MNTVEITCPECNENIGTLLAEIDKRVITLNLNVEDEYNHLFECPHCYEVFKIELVFTRRTYLDEVERVTVK